MFFAADAKPSSARRALPDRLADDGPVVVVRRGHSLVRTLRPAPPLAARIEADPQRANHVEYTPVHYPERLPLAGPWLKAHGVRAMGRELDAVLAPFGPGRRIVLYDSPAQHALVGRLGEHLSVYLAIDDRTVTLSGAPIRGEEAAERALLSKVDRVVCVSEPLADVIRRRGPPGLRVDVLTNGYDDELFAADRSWLEPARLADAGRPRALVMGHVSERIDWGGLAAAARLRPQWTWVFVGPADAGAERQVERIRAAGGQARLHGPAPYAEIPAWVSWCDVCAVPYRLNDFTRASSPLKAIEALGAGAPVLSTAVPALQRFGDAIAWVGEADGQSYARALDDLLAAGRAPQAAARRRSAVAGDSWSAKAQRLREILAAAPAAPPPRTVDA